MESKSCSICGETKPLVDFCHDKRNHDGCKRYCKVCKRAWDAKYRSDPKVKADRKSLYRDYAREYKRTHKVMPRKNYAPRKDRETRAQAKRAWYARNPGATLAHSRLHEAIKTGKLPKATACTCTKCGNNANEYHHHNGYGDGHELDVIPLCRSCHRLLHSPYS